MPAIDEQFEDAFDRAAVQAALADVASGEDTPEPFVRRTLATDTGPLR